MQSSLRRAILILALASGPSHGQSLPTPRDVPYVGALRLEVDAMDIDHRVLRIHETMPVRPGHLSLLYPRWIPGKHSPTNLVKRLVGLRITASGRVIPWVRNVDELHAFEIDVPSGVSQIDIEFQQLVPRDSTGDTSALTDDALAVRWQGVLLYPAGFYASRILVDARLRLPDGWYYASALRPASTAPVAASSGGPAFDRVSLETLIDSPVFSARYYRRIDLDASSARPMTLDILATTQASLNATDEQIDIHRKLVEQADRLFGARHFAHYDFLLALSETKLGWGLEHHQSMEGSSNVGYFTEWDKNQDERYLIPHELTHSWNGKFRRPKDLWTPDFNQPEHNTLLWVYEGLTQYWGDVLAARSGMQEVEHIKEAWMYYATYMQATPGRRWRTLEDTTHDEVISGRIEPLDADSLQRNQDYYVEGALIWLDADTKIRELTQGRRSLDDFARGFFGIDDGRVEPLLYTRDDVVKQLEAIAPYDWATFFKTRIDGLVDAPVDGFERAGWRLAWTEKPTDRGRRGGASYWYSLGFSVDREGHIAYLQWEGLGWKNGVVKGASLLAVGMKAYSAEVLNAAVQQAKTDQAPIELLLKVDADYRLVRIDYHDGLRYPTLERVEGTPDLLSAILSAR